MLTDEQVGQEITSAQRGSDIHGLVEKIAYFLHLKTKNSADSNWFSAQDILLKWSDSPDSSFGGQIHDILNHKAYDSYQKKLFFHNPMNPYEDWITAQHELAKQVLWQQCRIYISMY